MTVATVKSLAHDRWGIQPADSVVSYKGAKLRQRSAIESLGISDGDRLDITIMYGKDISRFPRALKHPRVLRRPISSDGGDAVAFDKPEAIAVNDGSTHVSPGHVISDLEDACDSLYDDEDERKFRRSSVATARETSRLGDVSRCSDMLNKLIQLPTSEPTDVKKFGENLNSIAARYSSAVDEIGRQMSLCGPVLRSSKQYQMGGNAKSKRSPSTDTTDDMLVTSRTRTASFQKVAEVGTARKISDDSLGGATSPKNSFGKPGQALFRFDMPDEDRIARLAGRGQKGVALAPLSLPPAGTEDSARLTMHSTRRSSFRSNASSTTSMNKSGTMSKQISIAAASGGTDLQGLIAGVLKELLNSCALLMDATVREKEQHIESKAKIHDLLATEKRLRGEIEALRDQAHNADKAASKACLDALAIADDCAAMERRMKEVMASHVTLQMENDRLRESGGVIASVSSSSSSMTGVSQKNKLSTGEARLHWLRAASKIISDHEIAIQKQSSTPSALVNRVEEVRRTNLLLRVEELLRAKDLHIVPESLDTSVTELTGEILSLSATEAEQATLLSQLKAMMEFVAGGFSNDEDESTKASTLIGRGVSSDAAKGDSREVMSAMDRLKNDAISRHLTVSPMNSSSATAFVISATVATQTSDDDLSKLRKGALVNIKDLAGSSSSSDGDEEDSGEEREGEIDTPSPSSDMLASSSLVPSVTGKGVLVGRKRRRGKRKSTRRRSTAAEKARKGLNATAMSHADDSIFKDLESQVSRFLKAKSKKLSSLLLDNAWPRKMVLKVIADIYREKVMSDEIDDRESNARQTLREFVYDWFLKEYGLKHIAESKLMGFLRGVINAHRQRNGSRASTFLCIMHYMLGPSSTANEERFFVEVIKILNSLTGYPSFKESKSGDGPCMAQAKALQLISTVFGDASTDIKSELRRQILAESLNESKDEVAKIDVDALLEIVLMELRRRASDRAAVLREAFAKYDVNGDAVLTFEEFSALLLSLRSSLSTRASLKLFSEALQLTEAMTKSSDTLGHHVAGDSEVACDVVDVTAFIVVAERYELLPLGRAEIFILEGRALKANCSLSLALHRMKQLQLLP